jgi:hypothetical protein
MGIVIRLGAGHSTKFGSIPPQRHETLLFPKATNRMCGPQSFLFSGVRRTFPGLKGTVALT